MKGKKKCFGLLLALFIMLGLSLSVFSEDSKALSTTVTYTANQNVSAWTNVFPDCSTPSCLSQYNYFITEYTPFNSRNSLDLNVSIRARNTSNIGWISPRFFSSSGYNVTYFDCSNDFSDCFVQFTAIPVFITDTTFTLTDSLSNCPEIEPCPVIPDYPYEDDLTNIKNAVLLVGAVPIVIYFFYAIYKMIIGGVK